MCSTCPTVHARGPGPPDVRQCVEPPADPLGTETAVAARTLRDLVRLDSGQHTRTGLTDLPRVGHRVPEWEPEPLRRLGVHGRYAACRTADRREPTAHGTGSSRPARPADRVAGRH
ncbi:hypothetical protein GCM10020295_46140 [Streptomyces cinereospinus]